jgi:predicted glycoside hydrolase/deacetylase ChbG (UPF0249 family)
LGIVRHLIIIPHDLVCSPRVNRGIVQAHDPGIVTSASLLGERPAAVDAAEPARERLQPGIGCMPTSAAGG